MKRTFIGLIVLSFIFLVGCDKDSTYSGTYVLEYSKYVGDPIDAKNTMDNGEMVLNDDGTGKSSRNNVDYTVTWSVDGNIVTLTEAYNDKKINYNGVFESDELHLFNGDKTNDLTNEMVYIKK